jgi:hypothetical protein
MPISYFILIDQGDVEAPNHLAKATNTHILIADQKYGLKLPLHMNEFHL